MALLAASGYAKVIHKQEPILIQPPLKHCENQLLKVFWAIGRPKGQSTREPTTSGRQDGHLLSRLRLIVHLIEAFLEITHRDELIPRYGTLDIVRIRYEEELSDCNLVKL